jgi:hypothetical protein
LILLFQLRYLHGIRTQHSANLAAIRLGLIRLLDRTFDLGAHLIKLAAEMIERRPVLILGDEYDVGILRVVRLSD